jgi:hypothetical protein
MLILSRVLIYLVYQLSEMLTVVKRWTAQTVSYVSFMFRL